MSHNFNSLPLDEVQKLQHEALKRARNLKRVPRISYSEEFRSHGKPKSHEKMFEMTPEKRYSIEKVNENH